MAQRQSMTRHEAAKIGGAASAAKARAAVKDRDARVFELRGAGLSMRAIGAEVDLSPERVRQILERKPAA